MILTVLAAAVAVALGFLALGVAALVMALKHQPQAHVSATHTWERDRETIQVGYDGPDATAWTRQAFPGLPPAGR